LKVDLNSMDDHDKVEIGGQAEVMVDRYEEKST
jgi:hypothetical protein